MEAEFRSLLVSGMFAHAKSNASKPNIPKSFLKDKSKALKEITESVEDQDPSVVRKDKQALLKASRQFTNKPKFIGGGWLFPDMKTSLFHHQVGHITQRHLILTNLNSY